MPKTRQTPKIETRLAAENHLRFDELCRMRGKTRTEVAREALMLFLDYEDKVRVDSSETLLEKRIRKMEDRLAALQARTAIDVGMIYHLIFMNMNKQTRDEDIAWAYHKAVERLKKKLQSYTKEIEEAAPKGGGTRSQE
jgi:predicted DNA-binding protein